LKVKEYFKLEKKPLRGLLAVEWVVMGYLLFTLVMMAILWDKLVNPESMLWGRVQFVVITMALWAVYRMIPCRLTLLARIGVQMIFLSWWYPDTYELNRVLPNLDHVFAGWEQAVFGCQPALLFSQKLPWAWFSELMCLGYASYYPLMALVAIYYFLYRYKEFGMASFVILASFFVYYVIFDLLPVTGPQYYYQAVGIEKIAAGVLPNIHDWFLTHREALAVPGWADGFCYQLVESAHAAGERPTAAFPSSHVGVTTVLMLLAHHSGSRKLFYTMLPFYVLMCFATVYIMAHYVLDAIAGLITGVVIYYLLYLIYKKMGLR
jgi:membrane-associated phospholipid phosphatase